MVLMVVGPHSLNIFSKFNTRQNRQFEFCKMLCKRFVEIELLFSNPTFYFFPSLSHFTFSFHFLSTFRFTFSKYFLFLLFSSLSHFTLPLYFLFHFIMTLLDSNNFLSPFSYPTLPLNFLTLFYLYSFSLNFSRYSSIHLLTPLSSLFSHSTFSIYFLTSLYLLFSCFISILTLFYQVVSYFTYTLHFSLHFLILFFLSIFHAI